VALRFLENLYTSDIVLYEKVMHMYLYVCFLSSGRYCVKSIQVCIFKQYLMQKVLVCVKLHPYKILLLVYV